MNIREVDKGPFPMFGLTDSSATGFGRFVVLFARIGLLCGSVVTFGLVGTPPLLYLIMVGITVISLPAVLVLEDGKSSFRYWALYFLAFVLFVYFRSFADQTGIPVRYRYVIDFDRALFFGNVPTVWLQERFYQGKKGWLEVVLIFVHLSYFIVPHVFGLLLWRSVARLRQYALAAVLTLGIGLLLYFLVPTAPPWLAAELGMLPRGTRIIAALGEWTGYANYSRIYQLFGAPNPVAAMPSLHTALTCLVTLVLGQMGGWWRRLGWLYLVTMALALLYLGEHYVADILAGCGVAWLAWSVAARFPLRHGEPIRSDT